MNIEGIQTPAGLPHGRPPLWMPSHRIWTPERARRPKRIKASGFVQGQTQFVNVNTPVTMVLSLAVGAGDVITVGVANANGSMGTAPNWSVTDGTNTYDYIANGQQQAGGAISLEQYYAWNVAAAGAGALTISITAAGTNTATQATAAAMELSGIQSTADPLDVFTGASTSGPTSFSTGTITPTANGMGGCFYFDNASGVTVGTGWALGAYDASNTQGLGEYMATTSGVGFVGSGNGGGGFVFALVASFKNAPAGGPPVIGQIYSAAGW